MSSPVDTSHTSTDPVQVISELDDGRTSSKAVETLEQLSLTNELIPILFNKIMDISSPLSITQKKSILKLIGGEFELGISFIYKILGAVGYPRVYYQDGTKIKQKKLPLTLQTAVLSWMVSNVYVFGPQVFLTLHKLNVVLFNLLSFEFCRVQICHLIFLTLSNTNKAYSFNNDQVPIVKNWQIRIVVDLALKFPLDLSLKALLAVFRTLVPGLDFKNFTTRYDELISTRDRVGLKSPFGDKVPVEETKKRIFDTCVSQYQSFNGSNKRRKTQTSTLADFQSKLSIKDITSLSDLVLNFRDVHINYQDLICSEDTDRNAVNHVIIKCLVDGTDRDFEFHLNNAFGSMDPDGYRTTCRVSEKFTKAWKLYNFEKFIPQTVFELAYCGYGDKHAGRIGVTYFETQQNILNMLRHSGSRHMKFRDLYRMFSNLIAQSKPWVQTFNKVMEYFVPRWIEFPPLDFVRFLRIFKKISPSDLAQLDPKAVLLPVGVIYSLLFTMNPLVFSEMCGYIISIKQYPFDEEYKKIYNSITMDILNFIWRDRAFFKQAGSLHQAMFLDEGFVEKLPMMNAFNKSKLVDPHNVGNLFHNPIWSCIVTELVWELEDEYPQDILRHPGPITPESIGTLLSDPTVQWLDLDYDEIKVKLLQKLDALGFKGLCEFLFGSLRSLQNTR